MKPAYGSRQPALIHPVKDRSQQGLRPSSRLEDVATANPTLGHGLVCGGDLVQRHDRVNSGRQLARRGAGEQGVWLKAVGVRYDSGYADPAFRLRLGVGLDANKGPAVAEQGKAALLQRRAVGDYIPARFGPRGEVGAEVTVEAIHQGRRLGCRPPRVHAKAGGDRGAREVPAQAGVYGLIDQPLGMGNTACAPRADEVTDAAATSPRTWPGPGGRTGSRSRSLTS
jgi:hypothetical protein